MQQLSEKLGVGGIMVLKLVYKFWFCLNFSAVTCNASTTVFSFRFILIVRDFVSFSF